MSLLDWFSRKPKKRSNKGNQMSLRAAFLMGQQSRLYKDWPTTGGTADQEIYQYLEAMRNRSRHLKKNNDYARRFSGLLKTNVVGHQGIKLQVRAKDDKGDLDQADNNYIESGWQDWGRTGSPTTDGKMSIVDAQKMFIDTMAFDGECIIRKIKPWDGNKYGFALQFIEADLLDHTLNKVLPNGNAIRLGVEFDQWRRPINYYFTTPYKNSVTIFNEYPQTYGRHQIVPASEIIHGFIPDRIGQSRGVPWLVSAGRRLHMLGGYEDAELVASRTAASKMGFFTSDSGEGYSGDEEDAADPTKTPIMNAEPGTFEELPKGMDFTPWDPQHPVSAFEPFVLALLRGAASGLNVSYTSLANDLRSVSYSSIRQGTLAERDEWKTLQGWMIEHFMDDIYREWLVMSILNGALNLPIYKVQKFYTVVWHGRRWQWVDPTKEVKAYKDAIKGGLNAPQDVIAENGGDFYDTVELIKEAAEQTKDLPIDMYVQKQPEVKGASNAGTNKPAANEE